VIFTTKTEVKCEGSYDFTIYDPPMYFNSSNKWGVGNDRYLRLISVKVILKVTNPEKEASGTYDDKGNITFTLLTGMKVELKEATIMEQFIQAHLLVNL